MNISSRSSAIKYIIKDWKHITKYSKRSLRSFCNDSYIAETCIHLMYEFNITIEDIEKYILLL